MKIVLVTGGFDPIHSGHIAYLREARELGNKLVVGINSDDWLIRKKGRAFMPWEERATIIAAMHVVDRVINFNDSDGTAIDAIRKVKEIYKNHEIIFANGGDRNKENIPEMSASDVEFVFGVGGTDKKNSSSLILKDWASPKTLRPWGFYKVLHDLPGCKVKELVIEPGKSLSTQRHFKRAEHWYVLKGKCQVEIINDDISKINVIEQNHSYVIGQNVWHRGFNHFSEPCHILEVQHGEICVEDDIERM
jgi:cytidyltransferase-like protein